MFDFLDFGSLVTDGATEKRLQKEKEAKEKMDKYIAELREQERLLTEKLAAEKKSIEAPVDIPVVSTPCLEAPKKGRPRLTESEKIARAVEKANATTNTIAAANRFFKGNKPTSSVKEFEKLRSKKVAKIRSCLKCEKSFQSCGPQNRLCSACKFNNESTCLPGSWDSSYT